VDKWVGSLEPGKSADFAIWSDSPVDSRTMCLQTWIEGKRYFERVAELKRSMARATELAALREKAKKIAAGGEGKGDGKGDGGKFFESSLEHRFDYGWEVDCMGAKRAGAHDHR
jgi:hypothetical protein